VVEGEREGIVAQDDDAGRRLVRVEEVIHETERGAVVDRVDIGDLLVASAQLAGPVRSIILFGLGARHGGGERGDAERHHAGNTGEEAAARRQ
jgi:hypothetical protein